jgi:hypothetical protein
MQSWQPMIQLGKKILYDIDPPHLLDGQFKSACEFAWVITRYRFPQSLGAGGIGEPVASSQSNAMTRFFLISQSPLFFV